MLNTYTQRTSYTQSYVICGLSLLLTFKKKFPYFLNLVKSTFTEKCPVTCMKEVIFPVSSKILSKRQHVVVNKALPWISSEEY